MSTPSPSLSVETPQGEQEVKFHKHSLDVLNTVKTSQIQFGLRQQDYQRYRKYCSRHLLRVRKAVKATHGKKFTPRPLEPLQLKQDARFLLIPLYKSERAWAYANQLKQDMEINPSQRIKYHIIKRLDKAAKSAHEFFGHCQEFADEKTILEAEAYSLWISAIALNEREQWKTALGKFVKARKIYLQLEKLPNINHKELFTQKAEEIEPSIRFCNYNLKGVGVISDEDLNADDKALLEKLDAITEGAKSEGNDQEIEWRGKKLSLKNEHVQSHLFKAQELSYETERSDTLENKMDLFDKISVSYNEAVRLLRSELSILQKTAAKNKLIKSDAQEFILQGLISYVSYLKLEKTVERGLLLIESLSHNLEGDQSKSTIKKGYKAKRPTKQDDLVRLFDSLLQNLEEMSELKGKDDVDGSKELDARILEFKAFRCYHLAQAFAQCSKLPEAMALFERALEEASVAKSRFTALNKPNKHDLLRIENLENNIRISKIKVHAKTFLASVENEQDVSQGVSKLSISSEEISSTSKSLQSNLDVFSSQFIEEKKIAEFPPPFEAVPAKPLLFDLASTSLVFPNLEAKKKAKSGWFGGFFGR